jgi:hypothetical protein
MKPSSGIILCTLLAAAGLQAQIAAPNPGIVRYADLPLQALLGIPGNLVPVATTLGDAEAVSFSDTAGLIVRGNVIRLEHLDGSLIGEYEYTGTLPVLGADPSPASAIAWLPEAHAIVWWNGKNFRKITIDAFQGLVNSVRMDGAQAARFLINSPDSTTSSARVSLPDGNPISVDYLPGVSAPVFEFGSYRISADEHGLMLEQSGGMPAALPFPAARFTAEQMSSVWVHLYVPANRQHWALHLNRESPTLSRLPIPLAAKGEQR